MSESTRNTIRDYAIALGAVVVATALSVALSHAAPKLNVVGLIFLCAICVAAWRGYGPGLFASAVTLYGAPFALVSAFRLDSVPIVRIAQTLLISLLVSKIASIQRRARRDLQQGVAQRTSELEKINGELQQTQRRLNDVLNSVSESFLALDREWRFTFVNRRIADTLGLTPEEVAGKNIWDVFPEARDSEFYVQYKRVMDERVPVQFEFRYAHSGRWFHVMAHPTPDGLSAYVVDISARKEQEINQARLASIVESSVDAIVSKDLNGVIQTWNSSAERVYGYSAGEAIGLPMESIVARERVEEERGILEKLRRGERIDHFETTRVHKNGGEIQVSLTISPLRDADGTVVGASHIARDITERRNFERQLHQMQKLESLGVLAGGVAHDFNNLLVGIVGNASLAMDDVPPQSRGCLQDVISAGERAADLTRQLLAYAGKGKVHSRLIDLTEMVREISALVRASIPRSVDLKLDLANELSPILADAGQIQQIVMNLVINAAEAIGPDTPGSVSVTVAEVHADDRYLSTLVGTNEIPPGHYVTLEVQDTGCGMDEATVAKIFDPFFTTKFLGRGLGLSAVLGIVHSHNGALKVYSAPGKGTTFRIILPAAKGRAADGASAEEGTSDFRGAGTVLVVDDDEMVRKVARGALERHGYRVKEASNGKAALDELESAEIEVCAVLLDLTMPVMGGEEALRHITLRNPKLPVILSSGFNESEAMQRFAGKGVAAFLQKPYTAVQLARVLHGVRDCREPAGTP